MVPPSAAAPNQEPIAAPNQEPIATPNQEPIAPPTTPGDLSPGSAAASLFDLGAAEANPDGSAIGPDQAPACPPPRLTCATERASDADAGVGAAAQARLQSHLEGAAAAVPHLSERPPPTLRRDLDGRYHFDNAAIGAVIHPDGSVEFEDKVGSLGPIPITGGFDITFFVEKYILKKTIFAEEKAWFLRETADLRARLTDGARKQVLADGARALRGRLIALIEDERRSPADRRAAVFATWDTCAHDAEGLRGQRIIEQLIRQRMPQGSRLGYSELELAELNARRASPRPFAPYDTDDAGTPGPPA